MVNTTPSDRVAEVDGIGYQKEADKDRSGISTSIVREDSRSNVDSQVLLQVAQQVVHIT